ncbi:aldose epimerase family protein [Roseitranquillus sediminis]|uniref:aldose epimerase family protein n=1 Tax=Roseitranquillus sediminis TaxID=2809051 RepID=UPI001D0C1A85|nr:aldose epimerase family protein [Roseitranquillus sediminis]MBM9593651.1 galactose mutarotase [Roseitranquillus sediminis]
MTIERFGAMPDGTVVDRIVLSDGELTVGLLTLGAILQDVRLRGVPLGLTLGSPGLDAYLGPMRFHGAVIGPVANRIAGAHARIDGVPHRFPANFGSHTLHSGDAGTQGKVWRIEAADVASATLAIDLPADEGGFPGNRTLRATWHLAPPAGIELIVTAETDAPTLMMVAHHPYWNLDGTDTWDGHALEVEADRYLPADAVDLPTGEVLDVSGTPYDFREPRIVPREPLYDNSLCLADARRQLTRVARLRGRSGLALDIATTEPALHLYGGHGADTSGVAGHDGRRYGPRAGLALEPQFWPAASGYTHFPDITLRPGNDWRQHTRYDFVR